MVKIVFCLRRRPHLSREEFQAYWSTHHAPLVAERARRLGIRRYVQSHTISDPKLNGLADQRGTQELPYDGVAELWFDSAAILYSRADLPEAIVQAGLDLLDDERQFIDLERSPIFVAQEQEIIPLA